MTKLLLVAALLLGGCASPACQAVHALAVSWDVISKEYVQYVEEDKDLTEDQKDRRKLHVAKHTELLGKLEEPCNGN